MLREDDRLPTVMDVMARLAINSDWGAGMADRRRDQLGRDSPATVLRRSWIVSILSAGLDEAR